MTPVVIDASAGLEFLTNTDRGSALRALLPADVKAWTVETFSIEVGTVLRKWELHAFLTPEQIRSALMALGAWPLRVARVRPLFDDAWRLRHNITFADATYVALAEHLGAEVLTGDHRLAAAPTLAVRVLRLPSTQ